ncbi:DUF2087 domain-containing protein [Streptomyces sp. SID13031]|uniref:DUF2087 domain-containing protein n=1 Tax=Streptomyces sp. SID13031 TaxID=2706046 RepID=UPI0013CAA94E|nr:DUF2087 domain-containing protein [Streptomyces sp. SID13031]NEA32583.1 DUF2087 domain-containing protein [Streptomyces sp. SID13031]
MNADLLCGSLAEPSRLRTYSAVVLGARTPHQIATATGLDPAVIGKAAQRLLKTGLLTASADGLHPVEDVFKEAARSGRREVEPLDPDPARDAVLRAFIRDGRLTHFPTVPAKTRIVLEYLVKSFEPGRSYPESEVNTILNAWHPDHAALRRLLVENQLITRTDAIYQRTS